MRELYPHTRRKTIDIKNKKEENSSMISHVDKEWQETADEHALHLAEMYIFKGEIARIAETLKNLHPMKALSFLYDRAHYYRHLPTPNHRRVAIILSAARLIPRNRTFNPPREVLLLYNPTNFHTEFTKNPHHTPAEIFATNIEVPA